MASDSTSTTATDASDTATTAASLQHLYLYVGLSNGVMHRASVDATSGAISDIRQRFLGAKPVKLFKISHGQGNDGVLLALSSRSWLSYTHRGRHITTPLSYEPLEYAGNFCTEHCPNGIVAISDTFLRIIAVERRGEAFNQQAIPLRYTPRQIAQLQPAENSMETDSVTRIVIVESDADEYNIEEREMLKALDTPTSTTATITDGTGVDMLANATATSNSSNGNGAAAMDIDKAPKEPGDEESDDDNDEEQEEEIIMPIKGPLPPTLGKWASCIRLVNPKTATTLECLELANNDAAFSVTPVVFNSRGGEVFIGIGIVRSLLFHPRSHSGCSISIYRVLDNRLVLLHTTDVPDVPLAMCEFQGRLLVGSGQSLRLYDLGKRKLLLKCELKGLPTMVVSLSVTGDRIMIGDMIESLLYAKYRRLENQLVIFADDQVPRMTARACLLDYDTAAGSDKFGNFFVLRVPEQVSDDVDNPTGNRMLWDSTNTNTAPNKLDQLAQFHLGDVITSLQKTSLVPGGSQVVLYSTINGSIGAFLPFATKDDVDFFNSLEMYMRQERPTLCGREHQSYRSYYLPVRAVIDGELCELFNTLPHDTQKKVAHGLDRTIAEVSKKLEDIRNRLL